MVQDYRRGVGTGMGVRGAGSWLPLGMKNPTPWAVTLFIAGASMVGAAGCSATPGPRVFQEVRAENPAVVELPEAPEGFDQIRKGTPRGTLSGMEYDSTTTGERRRMLVYTPPGFPAAGVKYPVFYLLHGRGDDETGWSQKGQAEVIFDNLLADNRMAPMIVVMPNGHVGTGGTKGDPKAPPPDGPRFGEELLNDIMPLIETRYPVAQTGDRRALAGLSMGGAQSLNIGLSQPGRFGYLGGFSSGPSLRPPDELLTSTEIANLRLLWVSCGDNDELLPFSQRQHEGLEARGLKHIWHLTPRGAHDWKVWKNDLYWFTQRLFR
jgi:enterochelin esterase-like enzyme